MLGDMIIQACLGQAWLEKMMLLVFSPTVSEGCCILGCMLHLMLPDLVEYCHVLVMGVRLHHHHDHCHCCCQWTSFFCHCVDSCLDWIPFINRHYLNDPDELEHARYTSGKLRSSSMQWCRYLKTFKAVVFDHFVHAPFFYGMYLKNMHRHFLTFW